MSHGETVFLVSDKLCNFQTGHDMIKYILLLIYENKLCLNYVFSRLFRVSEVNEVPITSHI